MRTKDSANQSASSDSERLRSISSCFVKVGTFKAIPGKFTPLPFSINPSLIATQSIVWFETSSVTSKESLPSSISIFAPGLTFSKWTPSEIEIEFWLFLSLLNKTGSPFVIFIFSFKPLTLIFGPAISARIEGLNPDGVFKDFTRLK